MAGARLPPKASAQRPQRRKSEHQNGIGDQPRPETLPRKLRELGGDGRHEKLTDGSDDNHEGNHACGCLRPLIVHIATR
jgi:hypothetical protein